MKLDFRDAWSSCVIALHKPEMISSPSLAWQAMSPNVCVNPLNKGIALMAMPRKQLFVPLQMGLAESQLRRWMLSMTALLRSQNGALSAAIDLWHSNCARQFEGVEECLICYSIIQAEGGQLPKLSCRTCSKRYHKTCLYKWFRSSSKSVCPHCQSTW